MAENGLVPDENALYLRELRTASHPNQAWSAATSHAARDTSSSRRKQELIVVTVARRTMQVLLKPEPLRQSPHVLSQGCTEVPLATDDGADPHRVVSALGYR